MHIVLQRTFGLAVAIVLIYISFLAKPADCVTTSITFEKSHDFSGWMHCSPNKWKDDPHAHQGNSAYKSGAITGTGISSISRTIMGPAVVDFWWDYQPVPHINPDDPNEGSRFSLLVNGTPERDWQCSKTSWNHEKDIILEKRKPYNLTWVVSKYKDIPGSDAIGWIDDLNITTDEKKLYVELYNPSIGQEINMSSNRQEVDFSYAPRGDLGVVSCTFYLDNKTTDFKPSQPTNKKEIFKQEFDKPGDHTWKIECCNNANECSSSVSNFSIVIPQPKVNILIPKLMCPRKELCLYIWIDSILNISKAKVTINTPIYFQSKGHLGTGFFEGVERIYNIYSASKNTTRTGGLWINYSISQKAKGINFINISQISLTTSSGETILIGPISKSVTVVDTVDKDYPRDFKMEYDPNNWKGSECRNYLDDDISHLVDCTI